MENAAMSSSNNSIELLKSFAEAGAALEQLPKVQADLEAAHSLIDETNAKLHSEQDRSAQLRAEMEKVRAELAQREADLAQAMFRHNEAQKVIDSIRGVLPSVAGNADHHADASVTDNAPATTRGQDQGQGQSDVGESAPDHAPQSGNQSAPTSNAAHTEGESVGASTTPGEATHNTPSNPSDGQSQSTERTDPTVPESSANTNAGHSAEGEHRPAQSRQYEGSGYWAKPSDMTWNDFAAKGGLVPSWVVNRDGV
jgi:hypothetical protein